MKRFGKVLIAASLIALSMSTTAFAGTWQQNDQGWWWQEDDKSYPTERWEWIDGNGDGIAECYYFDASGYLLTGTTTPDGYTVNSNGAWVDHGLIQEKALTPSADAYVKDIGRRLYLSASQKTSELNSMAAKAKLNMVLGSQGVSLGLTMDMDMKFKDLNTSSMKYLATSNASFLGQSITQTIFYADGYYYMDMMGEKTKIAMSLDEMVQAAKTSQASTMDTEYITDFQTADAGNGSTLITFATNEDAMKTYIDTIYSAMGINTSDYEITFRDMNGSITVSPEGYCTSQDVTMTMDLAIYGESLTMIMDIHIDYINPGQPVDFALPSTAGYTEMQQ